MATPTQPMPVVAGEPVSLALLEFIKSDPSSSEEWKAATAGMIEDRCAYGMKKYNQRLMTEDGRNTVQDAKEEVGDFLQYAFKAYMRGELPQLKKQMEPHLHFLKLILAIPDDKKWEKKE